jgi:hypothetical protein
MHRCIQAPPAQVHTSAYVSAALNSHDSTNVNDRGTVGNLNDRRQLLLLLLYWIRALPDRPFGSQTWLIGQHSTKDTTAGKTTEPQCTNALTFSAPFWCKSSHCLLSTDNHPRKHCQSHQANVFTEWANNPHRRQTFHRNKASMIVQGKSI